VTPQPPAERQQLGAGHPQPVDQDNRIRRPASFRRPPIRHPVPPRVDRPGRAIGDEAPRAVNAPTGPIPAPLTGINRRHRTAGLQWQSAQDPPSQ
jgi:hypothetical protein